MRRDRAAASAQATPWDDRPKEEAPVPGGARSSAQTDGEPEPSAARIAGTHPRSPISGETEPRPDGAFAVVKRADQAVVDTAPVPAPAAIKAEQEKASVVRPATTVDHIEQIEPDFGDTAPSAEPTMLLAATPAAPTPTVVDFGPDEAYATPPPAPGLTVEAFEPEAEPSRRRRHHPHRRMRLPPNRCP